MKLRQIINFRHRSPELSPDKVESCNKVLFLIRAFNNPDTSAEEKSEVYNQIRDLVRSNKLTIEELVEQNNKRNSLSNLEKYLKEGNLREIFKSDD